MVPRVDVRPPVTLETAAKVGVVLPATIDGRYLKQGEKGKV